MNPVERPAAMLVVEMQNDLCAPSLVKTDGLRGALARAVAKRGVLGKLAALLDACRRNGVTVCYLNKERVPGAPPPEHAPIYRTAAREPILLSGTPGADVVDELKPQPGDRVIARTTSIDPSFGSDLWEVLAEEFEAKTLIVAGISTTMAVEGTVRAAANRGYRVVVAEDCCASVPEEWHRFSADNVLPLLATVAPGDAVARAIER
jgi:nicotinamidase-related amidase